MRINLPKRPCPISPLRKERRYRMNGGGRKIMVVDDEADVISILKALLERKGYSVIDAASGKECLDKLKTIRPDLIILDIMMPDIDGWEVCKRIKEDKSTGSIPVSMLSVKRDREDIEKSLKYAHADMHLTKPIDLREVTNTVETLLKGDPS